MPEGVLAAGVRSYAVVRADFHDKVRRELLGPCGGSDEEVDENSISWRYLVGWLAPRNTPPVSDDLDDGPLDTPGQEDTAEEGRADEPVLRSASMLPNSFGLTCCLSRDVQRVRVNVEWGWYRKRESETGILNEKGDTKRVWYRTPVVRETVLELRQGELAAWSPFEEAPEVQVTGQTSDWGEGTRLLTLFLVNGQENIRNRDDLWLFQARLSVQAADGGACFVARTATRVEDALDPLDRHAAEEMRMAYRNEVEFALGHGIAVEWDRGATPDCATAIRTTAMPQSEVARSRPKEISDLLIRMAALGEAEQAELPRLLSPLASEYEAWIGRERARADRRDDRLDGFEAPAARALSQASTAATRIQQGIELLATDRTAFEAFRFMNRAMHSQRLHSLLSQRIRRGEAVGIDDIDESPSWYPFQLAFILLNLPSLTDPTHPERTDPGALAELLWFPTGGGKTEAYLGLTAYTLALRRLQPATPAGSGAEGVGVLMRYTLRLLTLQQFQRATALICACEVLRRADEGTWGTTPFRIGLWLGQASTPNNFDQAKLLLDDPHGAYSGGVGSSGTLRQLTNCPWCGRNIDSRSDIKADDARRRVLVYCGDPMGRCPFSATRAEGEGLPICIVDEDVYRLLPGLVIATVDKFAQMPWNGETQLLFGKVTGKCARHGFLCPSSKHEAQSHRATATLPATRVESHPTLRPPDLIIQDELHLITGPLGTMVGIYETAIDELCSWTAEDGTRVRPKVVVSTATIQRAADQVNSLFQRRLAVFPPRGLDASDNFFSRQEPVTEQNWGLRYVGVCATGRRLKAALIRVYVACLCAAQTVFDEEGGTADPYMTLVGYFNSIRELGGMRRLIDDDIRSRAFRMEKRGLSRRSLRTDNYDELTSRKSAADIPTILDRLERQFGGTRPAYDALIATNMISVGVDVPRLGLMVVAGQPKMTAEYIQATSRVGRRHPGIVFTVFNWARPRDLSHYEAFGHYHATFHAQVEAPSVTPFSPGARERALTAVLVSLARLRTADCNAESGAQAVPQHSRLTDAAKAVIRRRVEQVVDLSLANEAAQEAQARLDQWALEAGRAAAAAGPLVYDRKREDHDRPLLLRPESGPWKLFTCPTSMREVELACDLILLPETTEVAEVGADAPAAESDPAGSPVEESEQ